MALRPFKLPSDLPVLIDLLPPCFEYPENPDWNLQPDEMEGMVDMLAGVRRMWPLFRTMQLVAPPLRDALRGYIWEEDGQPVGLTNIIRHGSTDQWEIGNVGVLTAFRRRGIARQLVQASVEYARSRGAKTITLDVVDGNVPAYNLYEALGFEHFSTRTVLVREQDGTPELTVAMPDEYAVERVSLSDWQPRFELAQRITPAPEQRYLPVEEGRFKRPLLLRPLMPVFFRATGSHPMEYLARVRADGTFVAAIGGSLRRRAGGMNELGITLDPTHGDLAPYLVRRMLADIARESPGRRIETIVREWQGPTLAALEEAGFQRKLDMCTMGIIVKRN